MNERARSYLLRGVKRPDLPPEVRNARSTKPWRLLQGTIFPHPSPADLHALEAAPLSTLDLRQEVAWQARELRRALRRNQRAGLRAKRGAHLLRRLRHLLEDLPDPAKLSREALQPYREDAALPPAITQRWEITRKRAA